MAKHCGNCANYRWGDKKTPPHSACATCIIEHTPNGDLPPSNWKAKPRTNPRTNADRIRALSDEELARFLESITDACADRASEGAGCGCCPIECNRYGDIETWLQQPAREE